MFKPQKPVVINSELVPLDIAIINTYTLYTKELFRDFKQKVQINNPSQVRRKI